MLQFRGAGLVMIFLCALVPRLIYSATRGDSLQWPDSRDYESVAESLLERGEFREEAGRQASRAPGYPIFLAGAFRLGMGYRGIYVVQSIADAVTCVVVALIGRRLLGKRVGFVSGMICAFFPFFIYFSGVLLAESLFMLTLALVFYLLLRVHDEIAFGWRGACGIALAAGVALGLSIHLRSSALLLPVFLLPFWFYRQKRRWRALAGWGLMMAAAGIVLLPWIVRNALLFEKFVPTTMQVGESLFEANSEYADGGPAMHRIDWVAERGGVMMGEVENNEYYKKRAVQYIKENPARFVILAVKKFARFWSPFPNAEDYRSAFYMWVSLAATVPIYLLAAAGVYFERGRRWLVMFLLWPVLYFTLLHIIFVGSVRYRTPIMPFIIILAAAGLSGIVYRIRKRSKGGVAHG